MITRRARPLEYAAAILLVLAPLGCQTSRDTPPPSTEVSLRALEWDRDRDGTNDSYTELVNRGSALVSSYMRLPDQTEIAFWSDDHRMFSMSDTNNDGRFDRFVFFTNMVPQQIFYRNANDTVAPSTDAELRNAQEFMGAMSQHFPAMVDASAGDPAADGVAFRSALSNIVQKALEIRAQQPAGGVQ